MSEQYEDCERDDRPNLKLHLWTKAEVLKAVPYLRAVLRSLREDWLQMRFAREKLHRLNARTGRADRAALIRRAETRREAELARTRLKETEGELLELDVFCLDPGRGLALVPFLHESMPAWFVFDMFSEEGLDSWRMHSDPPEVRRSLESLDKNSPWAMGWPW